MDMMDYMKYQTKEEFEAWIGMLCSRMEELSSLKEKS